MMSNKWEVSELHKSESTTADPGFKPEMMMSQKYDGVLNQNLLSTIKVENRKWSMTYKWEVS
jgi:hypothetical protein